MSAVNAHLAWGGVPRVPLGELVPFLGRNWAELPVEAALPLHALVQVLGAAEEVVEAGKGCKGYYKATATS